jgi:uncharacterized OsmC-like protein
MAENNAFKVRLELLEDYVFKIDFGEFGYILSDEPAPLGSGEGPNPSRLLAAAVANCLCASLLFALRKKKQQPAAISAEVEGRIDRVDGRWRITSLDVLLDLDTATLEPDALAAAMAQFEDFCIVTQSIRQGIPVAVSVRDQQGALLSQ